MVASVALTSFTYVLQFPPLRISVPSRRGGMEIPEYDLEL